MIGTIGFIVGALSIAAFAVTARKAYSDTPPRKLNLFCTAFGLLSASLLLWATALLMHQDVATRMLMIATDCLLVLATGSMALVLLDRPSIPLQVGLGVAGSMAIMLRAVAYPSTAYIRDGLLFFDLTQPVRLVIIGMFLICWLPAVIVVASYIANTPRLRSLQNLFTALFILLIAVTALFVSAQRQTVIIGLFVGITTLFVSMTCINILVLRIRAIKDTTYAA